MDFGGLLFLGLLWLLFNLIGKVNTGAGPRTLPKKPRALSDYDGRTTGDLRDPSQREGSRLEQLLLELERNLGQAGGTRPTSKRAAPRSAPQPETRAAPPPADEEVVEERDSLEEPERVVSLETETHRRERQRYDQDEHAEEVVQRRLAAARARERGLTRADHQAFDARIRQEPADHTAVRRYTPDQLRDAIVWREILGPPVSERERER